jgi:hypothetical protein
MANTSLQLHIEELVLVGFPPADRFRIQDAVQAELMDLLAAGGLRLPQPAESLAIDATAPQTARVSARPTAAQLGAGVARSIVDGVGGTLSPREPAVTTLRESPAVSGTRSPE